MLSFFHLTVFEAMMRLKSVTLAADELELPGSVAKIVKLEHAWRRLDGRNDDGFQVAPFPGWCSPVGGALVLSLSDQLSRLCGTARGTRHFSRHYEELQLGSVIRPGDGEAAELIRAEWRCSEQAPE